MTTIPVLPPVPNKTSDTVQQFSDKADAFTGALPAWGVAANLLGGELNDLGVDLTAKHGVVLTKAAEAAVSAATALAAPGTSSTSVSPMVLGTGSRTIQTQASKLYVPGMAIVAAYQGDPSGKWVHGVVTSYNGTTGDLSFVSDTFLGTGTESLWIISISAPLPINSTVFTGTPSGPTATPGTSTNQFATTEFVQTELARKQVVSSAINLVANGNDYLFDSSAGAFTVTLPGAVSIGDRILIYDAGGNFDTYPPVLARNGIPIMGLAENMTLDVPNSRVELIYINPSRGWAVYLS